MSCAPPVAFFRVSVMAALPPPLVGTIEQGDLALEDNELGKGSAATVRKGILKRFGKEVAVKILREESSGSYFDSESSSICTYE